jgi:hypothetical protein
MEMSPPDFSRARDMAQHRMGHEERPEGAEGCVPVQEERPEGAEGCVPAQERPEISIHELCDDKLA